MANVRADTAPPSEGDTTVVDLNSRWATHVASILFLPVRQHDLPIIQFEVSDCLQACQRVRHWLQTTGPQEVQDLLRMENINLDRIGPNKKGDLFFLEGAATLEGDASAPVSIFALHVPNHKHVRYFWTPLSPSLLLSDLASDGLISAPIVRADQFNPTNSLTRGVLPPYHHTVYTIMVQCFHDLTRYPDSQAYIQASRISDVCPSVLDPDTAYQRIDAIEDLHSSHNPNANGKDLGNDRYILELHPAERALASFLYVGCAEYLLIKRTYFKAFSHETVLHAAKVRRAAANRRNMDRAAPLNGTEHVDTRNEDEEDEGDDDGSDDPPADIPPAGAVPADIPKPRAVSVAAPSRMRTRRAAHQQKLSGAVSLAGTKQVDITMGDAEAERGDETQSDALPADTPESRAAHLISRMRTRRTANQQNVKGAVSLDGTADTDVTMRDAMMEDGVMSANTTDIKAVPPITRSRMRTRQSIAELPATQSVNQATPLTGTEQAKMKEEDKRNEGEKNNGSPAVDSLNPRATARAAHSGARNTRRSAADLLATSVSRATPLAATKRQDEEIKEEGDDDKKNGESPAVDTPNSRTTAKAARSGARNTRRSAANALATPSQNGDVGDEDANDNRSYAPPVAAPPTAPPAALPTAPPAILPNPSTAPPTTRSGRRRRSRMTGTELSVARSNAANAGARNRAMRVRTQNKHIRTLEEEVATFTYRRAYKMILGWEVLGFLDEERVLAVLEGEDDEGPSDGEWEE